MSDNFRCELTFPRDALNRDSICDALRYDLNLSEEEVDELRNGEALDLEQIGPDYDQPGLICACDVHARLGEMETTERALFEAEFAFNASAEGYLEFEPEFRYWRPGMAAPATLKRTEGGDAYTLTPALREAIARTASMSDPGEIRAEFERLAEESDPAIVPIESYASALTENTA